MADDLREKAHAAAEAWRRGIPTADLDEAFYLALRAASATRCAGSK
jgi:hypothetical protein